MDKHSKTNEYYEIKKHLFINKEYSNVRYYIFKLKLFWRMNNNWFKNTPESDSLYRRRNRLIIIVLSSIWYFKSVNSVFDRIEIKVLSKNRFIVFNK